MHRLPEFDASAWTRGSLIMAVVGSLLAIGAVHPRTMGIIAGVGMIGLVAATQLGRKGRPFLPPPAIVFFLLAVACLLQLIPMPLATLERIAPVNADVWARALHPLGEAPPGTAPISLDPGATWIEALRWFSYGAVFVASSAVATRRGATWGVALVYVSALVAAITTLGHGLADAERVFGLYEPTFRPKPWHVGPLLNPNNLSGYLNLGAMCGLGLMMMRKPVVPRWVVAIGVAILIGVNGTTASRGGVVILVVGVLAFAITVTFTRRRRAQSLQDVHLSRWLLVGTILYGVALSFLGSNAAMWRELYNENLDKLTMVEWFKPMLADFKWVGTGRGAFESVFPAYQPHRGSTVYTHAENFVAHWAVEWGAPVAIATIVAFSWLFRPGRIGVGRSAVAAGAWFGLMILLIQNLVDLAFEVPAVCIAATTVLGTLWGDMRRVVHPAARRSSPRNGRLNRRWMVGSAAVACLLLLGAASGDWRDITSDRLVIRSLFEQHQPPRANNTRAELRAELRESMLRHPAEPYFPLVGALLAVQERDDNPMPWLQRTLERSMVNGKAHLLLAGELIRYGARNQALLELRLAVNSDATLLRQATTLGGRWAHTMGDVERLIPKGEQAVPVMDALALRLRQQGKSALGAELDVATLERAPRTVQPHARLATDIINRVAKGGSCDSACKDRLAAHIEMLADVQPSYSRAAQLEARWEIAHGRHDAAEAMLVKACDGVTDLASCLSLRVRAAARLEGPERLAAAGKALLNAVCMEPQQCAAKAAWLGSLHAKRKEWGAAVVNYRRAVRDNPTPKLYQQLARAASAAGLTGEAIRALERALSMPNGTNAALREQLEREREQLLRRMINETSYP